MVLLFLQVDVDTYLDLTVRDVEFTNTDFEASRKGKRTSWYLFDTRPVSPSAATKCIDAISLRRGSDGWRSSGSSEIHAQRSTVSSRASFSRRQVLFPVDCFSSGYISSSAACPVLQLHIRDASRVSFIPFSISSVLPIMFPLFRSCVALSFLTRCLDAQSIINGQIFTPGIAIVDAPQPNTPLGGGMFSFLCKPTDANI